MEFSYDHNNPTHGILWYLYNNDSIPYSSVVSTSSSSNLSETYLSEYAIDFNNDKYWTAHSTTSGAYITISIKYPILLKGYVIQTSKAAANGCHPKHWALSASFDGTTYSPKVAYDDVNSEMNYPLRYKYISYDNDNKLYRFFRLFNNGQSYSGETRFDLNQIEFFGTLFDSSVGKNYLRKKSCVCRSSRNNVVLVNLIIVIAYS